MPLKTGKTPIENTRVHLLTENELIAEAERLESLLEAGDLSEKDGRRLFKIRKSLSLIEDLKYEA